jgi:hypothetical protein
LDLKPKDLGTNAAERIVGGIVDYPNNIHEKGEGGNALQIMEGKLTGFEGLSANQKAEGDRIISLIQEAMKTSDEERGRQRAKKRGLPAAQSEPKPTPEPTGLTSHAVRLKSVETQTHE